MKMITDPFLDDLKAYTDGELPWLRRLAVRRHLTHCASCQEEISTMTQIAEDLRASDTEDTLPTDLRAKILAATGEKAPPPQVWGAGKKGHSTPVPPELGARGRTRPALGWAIAGVALIAWFVCFPAFQKVQEHARWTGHAVGLNNPDAESQLPHGRASAEDMGKMPAAKSKPVSLTVRLSDREAGTNETDGPISNGANATMPRPYAKITNSTSSNGAYDGNERVVKAPIVPIPGAVQTYDINNPAPDVAGSSLRQVHKEASIGVQVPNPEITSDTVENMVTETGGYVAANNLSTGDDGMKTAELIVKVPVAQFEMFLNHVAKLGNVQSKNITGEDITEKTSDADQEENVLEDDVQQSETGLKALSSRAKWHDEEATRELRVQLAQSRARLVLLKRMAALGTLTIDLSQTPKAVPAPPVTGGFLSNLKGNTHDALQSLMNSASALLALVIWLLAYAPIWIPLLLIGRYARRKYEAAQIKAG